MTFSLSKYEINARMKTFLTAISSIIAQKMKPTTRGTHLSDAKNQKRRADSVGTPSRVGQSLTSRARQVPADPVCLWPTLPIRHLHPDQHLLLSTSTHKAANRRML